MSISRESVGMVTLGATQGIVLFTVLMPERSELYKVTPTPDVIRNVRQGEWLASALTLGFSTLLAILSGDSLPLVIGASTVAVMCLAYEITLRSGC